MTRGLGHRGRGFAATWCAAAMIICSVAMNSPQRLWADTQQANAAAPAQANHAPEAAPYMDEPRKQLIKRVPQLKDLHAVESQQELPAILKKTGERVDDFFHHVTDLTAHEEISLTRYRQDFPTSRPEIQGERVRDSYLILRRSGKGRSEISEYRTDAKGANFDQSLVKKGYIVTSGFALNCNYFASDFQSESTFRLLGEQKVGGHETYVVGFAQQPGKATLTIKTRSRSGVPTQLLVQGVAWIERNTFQIVRLRTDLLTPRWDVGLNQETTEVTLSKFQLADLNTPLWLPSTVKVFVEYTTHNGEVDEFYELSYRNEHRYSEYQRYRVATKIVPQ